MDRWKRTALVGVGFGVLLIGSAGWAHERQAEVVAARERLVGLRAEVTSLRQAARTRDGLEEQLAGLKSAFSSYVQILPSPQIATEEEMLRQINTLCGQTDVRLLQWRREKNPRPRARKGRPPFEEVRLVLTVEAKMVAFLELLNGLERLPKLMRTNGFSLQSPDSLTYDGEAPALKATLEVSTFRYQG